MSAISAFVNEHRRASSSSTVRAANSARTSTLAHETLASILPPQATLWIHDDSFSTDEILINPSLFTRTRIVEGSLVEVVPQSDDSDVIDFEDGASDSGDPPKVDAGNESKQQGNTLTCLCIVKFASQDMLLKHQGLEVSITKTIAEAFQLRTRTQVILKPATFDQWTASHIELCFRDAYLARSDMWRLLSHELADKVVYRGQKITFLGSIKLTVKEVHVRGHRSSTGFFSANTIPVFRSEAARYVLFIQMSREMWDFDSEGNGEIMFNRVVNGFLPDLFRRWVQLEVRHLVSIVLFGRLEYDRYDFGDYTPSTGTDRFSQTSSASNPAPLFHQDFFRVVVTDMASAQWTTILNELKKDFQVFLRDISLHTPDYTPIGKDSKATLPRITGRPSTALKGNILEAINLASSQFANDYIDRDLIRTGVSTVVITAGSGVFDVDRDLLNLTSENLTNNGIGIDVVCLSRMPLHSVPLFRYKLPPSNMLSRVESNLSADSRGGAGGLMHHSVPSLDHSSALSSFTGTSANYFSRFPSAFPSKGPQLYGYGIPHWIDLSYWSPASGDQINRSQRKELRSQGYLAPGGKKPFVPRVRMYELQMMGLMELGMADIYIPYIVETPLQQKRPRHKRSADLSIVAPGKSLSQSPSYSRKQNTTIPRHRDSASVLHRSGNIENTHFDMMEEYDDLIFLDVKPRRKSSHNKRYKPRPTKPAKPELIPKSRPINQHENKAEALNDSLLQNRPSLKPSLKSSATKSEISPTKLKSTKSQPRISRSISYALRGLSAPFGSPALAEAKHENIKALPSMATTSLTQANAATLSVTRAESIRSSEVHDTDARSIISNDSGTDKPTRPISIAGNSQKPISQQVSDKLDVPVRTKGDTVKEKERTPGSRASMLSHSSEEDELKVANRADTVTDSVPHSNLPFIRNVNASNPLKSRSRTESMFGRWQHLYPHKPRASKVKWRSLCTPASVPLTTEDFPNAQELSENYETREHRIQVRKSPDMPDKSSTLDGLLFEMIILRLSHGYQIVVGDAVRKVFGNTLCEISVFLDPAKLSNYGDVLLMSMGNTIQKLSFADPQYIHVTKYVRRMIEIDAPFSPFYSYNPNIRTILAKDYWSRLMELRGFMEEYPWETADNYLADGEINSSSKVNKLRFWRARFVLLPVAPPANTWRPQQNNEDNEEEIHLLGIRALTQMWQRARYLSPSDRKTGPGRQARKPDSNPLEIKFDTLNPSELVTTELDKLLSLEESGEVSSTQLLPDSERLDRNAPMVKLAHAMQGEKGIEIKNRRWHLRLHYNCFHGEEFTNWLSHNVKNIETREDAVDFGNQLMKEGLFEHVNGRHNFKDGNYFYSLKQDFKLPRIDTKGSWFPGGRRSDRTVPPTPISEHPGREGPQTTTRSRSGSSLAYSLNPATPLESSRPFLDRRKKTVTLTKMIKIDVDIRKRSNRAEIVNLHYDRFHNPENCYHIELSWLNTTSKLVDDVIVAWTSQAEKYGLKLVEVPIAEASKIPNSEPFRRAYQIKLSVDPPKRAGHVLTTSSFTPQTNPERFLYQKAILKRFNFVLDLEGASEFPDNVDVQFSSAGLVYKYTQFVHRSGVCLAQITDEGDFLLLANRLFNARFANSREATTARHDSRREPVLGPGYSHRPPLHPSLTSSTSLQPSGIIGLNMQSPRMYSTPSPSPMTRATADVLGSRTAISNSTLAQFVTPEQIKDELEQFCSDPAKLEQFYKETNSGPIPGMPRKSTNGTSSSALKPIPDANEAIPEFVLPESIASPSTMASGFGLGNFGGLMSRRARASVAYESVAEMFSRSALSQDRSDSSRDRNEGGGSALQTTSSGGGRGTHSGEGSGRTSGDVSGHLELKVQVSTPSGRIAEGVEESMKDYIGSPRPKSQGKHRGSG